MDLVVLSGKGGTGKTTIAAALSELANDVVRIDCDVDASNLYLYYPGEDISKKAFYGGKLAVIDSHRCTKCGECQEICKFYAIEDFRIDALACEGCGACLLICPENAIQLEEGKSADAFLTQLEDGILSRAEMEIGSDGSGLLITLLRESAKDISRVGEITIIDGSPGIGCPVIASVTGSDEVLIVTEPTQSGLLDLKRVVELSRQFNIEPMICINKYDINRDIGKKIAYYLEEEYLHLVGKIPYDDIVMKSIQELKPIIYYDDSIAARAIEDMWINIKKLIFGEE